MDVLMGIITRHWGVEKARRAVDVIVRSKEEEENDAQRARERQKERLNHLGGTVRALKRSPGRWADVGSRENVRMGNASVPARKTSLRKAPNGKGSREGRLAGASKGNGGSGDAPEKRDAGGWSWAWW